MPLENELERNLKARLQAKPLSFPIEILKEILDDTNFGLLKYNIILKEMTFNSYGKKMSDIPN